MKGSGLMAGLPAVVLLTLRQEQSLLSPSHQRFSTGVTHFPSQMTHAEFICGLLSLPLSPPMLSSTSTFSADKSLQKFQLFRFLIKSQFVQGRVGGGVHWLNPCPASLS